MLNYMSRLRHMTLAQLTAEIDRKICDSYSQICHDRAFCIEANETEVGPWTVDDFAVVDEIDALDLRGSTAQVTVTYTAICDDALTISGSAVALIDEAGFVSYIQVHAEIGSGRESSTNSIEAISWFSLQRDEKTPSTYSDGNIPEQSMDTLQ